MNVLLVCPRKVTGGNLTYLKKIVSEYSKINVSNNIHLLTHSSNADTFKSYPNINLLSFSGGVELFAIKKTERSIKPHVVHFTNTLIPIFYPKNSKIKYVATIHDLNFLTVSQGFFKNIYKKKLYLNAAKMLDGAVFISHYTQSVFENFAQTSIKNSLVVHQAGGSDSILFDKVKTKKLVTFGHRKHKNPEAAIKILAELPTDFTLQIIGAYNYKQLLFLSESLGVTNRVKIYQGITDEEVASILSSAIALIFLSNYEGFGLPLLEAMTSSALVITHDMCSLKEVGGSAAYYIEDDEGGYFKASSYIQKNSKSDEFWKNNLLKLKHQSKLFSWETTAAKTISFYSKVLKNECE